MGSEFEAVLAEFKAKERPEDIIPILSDETAQKFLVAWPKIIIRRDISFTDPIPNTVNEQWVWLWEQVNVARQDIVNISGIPEMKIERIFMQMKGNRLIYPDGSVMVLAEKYLKKLISDKIKK